MLAARGDPNANADSAVQPDCAAGSGADTITLPAGTFTLSVGGNGNNAGDLDLTANLTIAGAGAGQTIVDGAAMSPRDRVLDIPAGVVATISGVTIQHGLTTGDGGGIRSAGTLTLRDVVVAENTGQDAGGILNDAGGTLTMVRTSIRDNTATEDAGGLRNQGTAPMTDGDVRGNRSGDDAGGIRNDRSLTMTGVTIFGNVAADTSGGIENRGSLTLADSTVDSNRANGGDGGGMQNQSGGTLTVVRSAIVRNVTAEDGGGIDFDVGRASLTNVTVSGNTAAVDGGGIEVSDAAIVNLTHVTIAANTAAQGRGFFNDTAAPATLTLRSVLISNGPSGANCAGATVISTGFNLEFPGRTCGLGTAQGDLFGVDPRLGPLATNDAHTLTHALLPGSPAIDAASNATCPSTDQRGFPRPTDGDGDGTARCDVGAFEAGPGSPVATNQRIEPNNDDEKDRKKETEEQRQQRQRTNRSNRDDEHTEGNVIQVGQDDLGPFIVIVNRDGDVVVRLNCKNGCATVKVGDYVMADGQKEHEHLFYAEEVEVAKR